jgi:hypothetical protein
MSSVIAGFAEEHILALWKYGVIINSVGFHVEFQETPTDLLQLRPGSPLG